MTEYRITAYLKNGIVRFRTEWTDIGIGDAHAITLELAGIYGLEHVELVMRKISRKGYEYKTLLASEI
jgi:hypothetical protein